jgi:hypothetical protein
MSTYAPSAPPYYQQPAITPVLPPNRVHSGVRVEKYEIYVSKGQNPSIVMPQPTYLPQATYMTTSSSGLSGSSASSGLPGETTVWEGTTWPACLCSPLLCSSVHWRITNRSVHTKHGCCGSKRDVLDLRRVTDLKYRCSPCFPCCRGTITIVSDDEDGDMHLTHFCIKDLFKNLATLRTTLQSVVAIH